MPISDRLKAAAAFIAFPSVTDIGTDHAFLPIYALKAGLAEKAVACDSSPASLAKARRNIAAAGFSGRIVTRLGSGLKPVARGEVQCAVLAGMGGHLITEILRESPEIAAELPQIILQPQNDVPFVRREARAMGMVIVDERIVRERGIYYNILNCAADLSAGGGGEPYSEAEYAFGRRLMERKDPILLEYLRVTIQKSEAALSKIRSGGSDAALLRVRELQKGIDLAKEAILRALT